MLPRLEELMRHEGEAFTEKMILRGSLERLSPVLMTALTAGIGLVPLVVEGHHRSRDLVSRCDGYPGWTDHCDLRGISNAARTILALCSGGDAERLVRMEQVPDGLDDPPTTESMPRALRHIDGSTPRKSCEYFHQGGLTCGCTIWQAYWQSWPG